MKASTAASLLRAARERFEAWGVLQIGRQEAIALEFAWAQTKNITLKEIQANGVMGLNRLNKDMYEALRVGYKALEKLPPDTKFTIEEDGTETTHGKTKLPSNPPDWIKDMGISFEDDIPPTE